MSSQTQELVPLMRFTWVQAFLDEADRRNVSIADGARRAQLPLLVAEPDELVRKRPVWRFVDDCVRHHDLSLFGFNTAVRACSSGIGVGLVNSHATTAPLCLHLKTLIQNMLNHANDMEIGLEVTGTGAYLRHRGMDSGSPLAAGAGQMELLVLGIFLSKLRLSLGQRWTPKILEMQAQSVSPALHAALPDTRICIGARMMRVWLSLTELSTMVSAPAFKSAALAPSQPEQVPVDLHASLRAGLISAFHEAYEIPVTLDLAAEMLGCSARTLQRLLQQKGLRFRDVMDEALVASAAPALLDTDVTVAELAATHGYSSTSHFVRAFKRATGLAPGEYRKTQALSLAAAG